MYIALRYITIKSILPVLKVILMGDREHLKKDGIKLNYGVITIINFVMLHIPVVGFKNYYVQRPNTQNAMSKGSKIAQSGDW